MAVRTKKDVMKIVKDRDVSFVQIWFPDILGMLKGFAITPSELEGALMEGMGFDGSSIEGFARIEESDMIAMPDPSTFQFLPWRPEDRPVARMFCDFFDHGHHGRSYPGHVGQAVEMAFIRAGSDAATMVTPSSPFTETAIVRTNAP